MKKVSIITPCYNGEKFVGRYLESVLNQTYKNIEMILVNDGSTDRTEEVVLEYKPLFEREGMEFIYIYQENAGQAAALNKGLAIFTGDYLTWPDSDDILTLDSIEKKVIFLENNEQYGLVRTAAELVDEDNIENIIGYYGKDNPNKYKENLFLDFITENRVWFAPGCYMVDSKKFLEVNPEKEIYVGQGGQNWQMLLPISYMYKCGYIDESLYKYVVRNNSHSRSVVTQEQQLVRCDDHEKTLVETLKAINMNETEKQRYISIIEEKYIRKKLYIAGNFKNKSLAMKQFQLLKTKKSIKKSDYLYYLMSKSQISSIFAKIVLKIALKIKYFAK